MPERARTDLWERWGATPSATRPEPGFPRPQIAFNQPVVARGESKRLLELSVAEAGPAFIGAELITSWVLDRTLVEMNQLAEDESVLAVMPRMSQVWARKPVLPDQPLVGS
jgi:hypothetical protein